MQHHAFLNKIWIIISSLPSNLQDNLKTDIFGPPCCPVPPGEIMERSDTLESQPGLAGNYENVSKVFLLAGNADNDSTVPQRLRGVRD